MSDAVWVHSPSAQHSFTLKKINAALRGSVAPCHIIAQALHGWLFSGAEGVVANGAAGGAESRLSHARIAQTRTVRHKLRAYRLGNKTR